MGDNNSFDKHAIFLTSRILWKVLDFLVLVSTDVDVASGLICEDVMEGELCRRRPL
jgi:hypothetical protein